MTGAPAALLGHRDEAQVLGTQGHDWEGVCALRTFLKLSPHTNLGWSSSRLNVRVRDINFYLV